MVYPHAGVINSLTQKPLKGLCWCHKSFEDFWNFFESTKVDYSAGFFSVDVAMFIFSSKLCCLFSGDSTKILAACEMIKSQISPASQVLYPSDLGYNASISHYILTSTTRSVCSVLPNTVNDVAAIVSDTTFVYRVKINNYIKVCFFLHVKIECFDISEVRTDKRSFLLRYYSLLFR